MKIAITALEPHINSLVDERFGRSKYILIYDSNTKNLEVIDNIQNSNLSSGAGIQTASLILEKNVDAILTGRVGFKALDILKKSNVKIVENISGNCQNAINNFLNNK